MGLMGSKMTGTIACTAYLKTANEGKTNSNNYLTAVGLCCRHLTTLPALYQDDTLTQRLVKY